MKLPGRAWMLLACLASSLAVSIAGVIYTGLSTQDNNRQWCELLGTLDSAYSSTPPTTDLGRRVAGSIHTLNVRFGCGEANDGE